MYNLFSGIFLKDSCNVLKKNATMTGPFGPGF